MKTYSYQQPYYSIEVVATGLFCIFLAVACLICAMLNVLLPPALACIFVAVALYQVWNTFVSISNPREVTIDNSTISFSAFGRNDTYSLENIDEFRVREFPSAGKMYIRINGGGLLRGRYWLQTSVMTDGKDLFQRMTDIEYAKHPETIKARARRVNTEYLEREDHIKAYKRDAHPNFIHKSSKGGRTNTREGGRRGMGSVSK